MEKRTKIRLILNLPRVGGTLFSRIISRGDAVCLLSEVHPSQNGADVLRELTSKGLISNRKLIRSKFYRRLFSSRSVDGWRDSIDLAISIRDKKIVIRDHTHINFTAPTSNDYTLQTLKSLNSFDVRALSLTRHPVDQFLSCMSRTGLQRFLTTERFVKGYIRYHQAIKGIPLFRYEDIVGDPYVAIRNACEVLDLDYDKEMVDQFSDIQSVSGDRDQPSRSYRERSVITLSRREGWDEAADEFKKYADLPPLLADLGYKI